MLNQTDSTELNYEGNEVVTMTLKRFTNYQKAQEKLDNERKEKDIIIRLLKGVLLATTHSMDNNVMANIGARLTALDYKLEVKLEAQREIHIGEGTKIIKI